MMRSKITNNLEKQNSLESASNSASYSSDDSTNHKEEIKTSSKEKHYSTFDETEKKEKVVRRKRSIHEVRMKGLLFIRKNCKC